MSKHQQAIDYFDGYGSKFDDLLIDLLERDTPMQVSKEKVNVKALDVETDEVVTFGSTPCPKCAKWLLKINNFCQYCGQRIEDKNAKI